MKIVTIYTPTDVTGKYINFNQLYTLADLVKLGEDLASAGVTEDDVLAFRVDNAGALTIDCMKVV